MLQYEYCTFVMRLYAQYWFASCLLHLFNILQPNVQNIPLSTSDCNMLYVYIYICNRCYIYAIDVISPITISFLKQSCHIKTHFRGIGL